MSSQPRLDQLDPEQLAAVTSEAAPLRVLAGPGAGKTRVLTQRIAHRAAEGDLDPRRLLALTFTRRAANELRSRLGRLGIRDVGAIGTFHAVALAQIRRYRVDHDKRPPVVLGNRRPFLAELLDDPRNTIDVPTPLAQSEIDWALAQGLEHHQYAGRPGSARVGASTAAGIAELMRTFAREKKRRGVLDFDDLITECTRLLLHDESFGDAQRWLFRHVFVDEFQDLNRPQFDLLRAWVGDRSDLFVVGDPDQAIYGWNGADASFLVDFDRAFPGTTTITLGSNHRSDPSIVAAASAVLGRAPAPTSREGGDTRLTVTEYPDDRAEAVGIARHIRWAREPGTTWGSYAVLARTNDQLAEISQVMTQLDVPHRIRGRGGMLRVPAVAEVVDQLVQAGPDMATVAADLVADLDGGPPATVARLALDFVREDPNPHGHGFRQWLRTVQPGDLDPGRDAVDLVTFHAAKGLEWVHVVIAGVEDGLVPIRDDAEERRLFYVALTRAERRLHLTWARQRTRNGLPQDRSPSPYLGAVRAATAPPDPPPPARVDEFIASARAATEPDDRTREAVVLGLREWRERAARARRVSERALLSDQALERIADATPADLDAMVAATGLSPHRLGRIAPDVLAVIHGTAR